MSRNEKEKAARNLQRLGYNGRHSAKKLAAIAVTLKIREETEGVTYWECFRHSNLRRTLTSVVPLCLVSLSGISFAASYATYYMQLAGYSTEMSFKLQITQQVMSMVGNMMAWYLGASRHPSGREAPALMD
jgi:SP family general alpha glucoside:H+ symporter-like MFS transporter